MKKFIIIIVFSLFTLSSLSPAFAIERVAKKDDSKNALEKTQVQTKEKVDKEKKDVKVKKGEPQKIEDQEKVKEVKKKSKKSIFDRLFKKAEKNYDYFQDKNKDGIDDKFEKKIIKKKTSVTEERKKIEKKETVKRESKEKKEQRKEKKPSRSKRKR